MFVDLDLSCACFPVVDFGNSLCVEMEQPNFLSFAKLLLNI